MTPRSLSPDHLEISAQYPAANNGGTWPGATQYGNPQGTQAYMGVDESGCNMVAAALDPTTKKPAFMSGLGEKRILDPADYVPGGPARSVAGCEAWTSLPTSWSWEPPPSITSGTTFAQWYTTTEGVNMEVPGDIALVEGVIDSNAFFPIDNAGFGNTPGQAHNYHFTTEVHVTFTYEGAQTFSFRGDDDLWVPVNNQLALDLGRRARADGGHDQLRRARDDARHHRWRNVRHGHLPRRTSDDGVELPRADEHHLLQAEPDHSLIARGSMGRG